MANTMYPLGSTTTWIIPKKPKIYMLDGHWVCAMDGIAGWSHDVSSAYVDWWQKWWEYRNPRQCVVHVNGKPWDVGATREGKAYDKPGVFRVSGLELRKAGQTPPDEYLCRVRDGLRITDKCLVQVLHGDSFYSVAPARWWWMSGIKEER